jgi:hypothetical protein
MIDTSILGACIASRSAWESLDGIVNAKDFSPPVQFWYGLLSEYYGRDKGVTSANAEILRETGLARIANPKQVEAITAVLTDACSGVSVPNIVALCLDLRRRNIILELAAASGSGDRKAANKLFTELVSIWDRQERPKSEIEYARDWADLDEIIGAHKRIPLGIKSLDSRIGGGCLAGNHVLIFGRTEIGKSCFTLSITSNLLKQGQRVLYIGNEDEINGLKGRIRCSLLQRTDTQVQSIPKKASRLLGELVGDRLTMVRMTPGSISELSDLVAKHSPTVCILDQIRNLDGPEDGMTRKMEANAIRFRSLLGKAHLLGISVTQAGDRSQGHNTEGPLYLSAGDVDSSRVGLPGQTDLQLGIGANSDLMARSLRMLSFAKNKLFSGTNSREPLMLHFDLSRSIVSDN